MDTATALSIRPFPAEGKTEQDAHREHKTAPQEAHHAAPKASQRPRLAVTAVEAVLFGTKPEVQFAAVLKSPEPGVVPQVASATGPAKTGPAQVNTTPASSARILSAVPRTKWAEPAPKTELSPLRPRHSAYFTHPVAGHARIH